MSKQHNYRELPSCANCRHVFVRREYDDGDELYCTHDAPPRPPCMSLAMGEHPWAIGSRDAALGDNTWDSWANGRSTQPNGICDAYEVKP